MSFLKKLSPIMFLIALLISSSALAEGGGSGGSTGDGKDWITRAKN